MKHRIESYHNIKLGFRLSIFLLVSAVFIMCFGGQATADEQEITILFTHDIHSYLEPKNAGTGENYGIARLKTIIDEIRNEKANTILIDGGDFSMGTLYQTLFSIDATELVMLGKLGYDATTLGNHEFDYRESGLTDMLYTAVEKEEQEGDFELPMILLSNIDWSRNTTEDNVKLKEAWELYGIKDSTIIERDGIKYGLFGIFGKNSAEDAPLSGLEFENQIATAKAEVEKLRGEGADLIICLSHSGTSKIPEKSEDELLAKAVPGIDVILSAHSHTVLNDPIIYDSTYIVSCGCYTHYLGELTLKKNSEGRYDLTGYKLHPVTGDVKEDTMIKEELNEYKKDIDRDYLSRFGYTYDQVIAHNPVEFISISDLEVKGLSEEPLANLIADGYRYAVEQAEGESSIPVDVAIVGKGMIRERIPVGDVKVKDVYDVCALGIGPDEIAGYPLVSLWLTGAELETAAEIDVSISDGGSAQLYPSGIRWTYNPNRLILNRVTEVSVEERDGSLSKIDKDKLYRVVTPLYCAQMLGSVQAKSKGLLTITPKNQDGTIITDAEAVIVRNHETGAELKEWYTLATYLESFEKNESGLPQVPETYAELQGRKVMAASWNPYELVKHPNKIAIILYIVIVVMILLIVIICRLIRKRRKISKISKK